ncbi:MAG: iron ABC transporter permease [Thiohalomonadaceae bacterium]
MRTFLLPLLLLLALASLVAGLTIGSLPIPPSAVWSALWDPTAPHHGVIMELRLPRLLAAFAVGGLLAVAGALLQVLLRNPLADPYILGVSGGAAVAALLAMLAGLGSGWVSGSALVGALGSMLLVFGLAHGGGSWTPTRLLLTGVVVAALWGALISFLLAVAPEHNLRGMLFWLMGDLSHGGTWRVPLALLLLGLLLLLPFARELNLLARGEITAGSLGVHVARLRLVVYFAASSLTAAAVTSAGSVGFIGLIVPHMLRLVAGSDHRLLLPASALFGGSLLMLADTLARSLIAPQQLPVGVLTALIGAPVFLYLLRREAMR